MRQKRKLAEMEDCLEVGLKEIEKLDASLKVQKKSLQTGSATAILDNYLQLRQERDAKSARLEALQLKELPDARNNLEALTKEIKDEASKLKHEIRVAEKRRLSCRESMVSLEEKLSDDILSDDIFQGDRKKYRDVTARDAIRAEIVKFQTEIIMLEFSVLPRLIDLQHNSEFVQRSFVEDKVFFKIKSILFIK